MRGLVYFLFFNLIHLHSIAFVNPDSLKKIVTTQKDTLLGNTFHLIAMHYLHENRQIDSAIKYETLSLKISQKFNSISRIINAKLNIGDAYIQIKKYDLAVKELKQAMQIAKQKNYTKGIIDINNSLGYLYGQKTEYEKSTFYFLNTAKEYEKLHDYNRLAFTYLNIAMTFGIQEQHEKSLKFIKNALLLIPKLNRQKDARTIAHIYAQTGDHYLNLYGVSNENSHLKKALSYADSCLEISTKNDVNFGLAGVYFIKCRYSYNIKDYKNVILFGKRGLEYRYSIPDENVFDYHFYLTQAYLQINDYKNAQLYLDSCKLNSKSKEYDTPMFIAELEYNLFKKLGDNVRALHAVEKLMAEKEKLRDTDKNKAINALEIKYETELKEEKIIKLNQQREIDNLRIRSLIAVIGITILLIVIIVFFYRQNAIKNKLKTIEIEQRLNRARMNPHFFFNALGSLQNLSMQKSKQELVPGFISKFSKIMRQSLESTFNEMETLESEILFLTDYLEIQKLRSENRFDYEFIIDETIEQSDILIPGMILQPFIENSIEHGFKDLSYAGLITVSFLIQSNLLEIKIQDNGVGVKDSEKHKTYPSRATQIINDRLFLLNKKYKTNANFVISKSNNNTGIEVKITLPTIYK